MFVAKHKEKGLYFTGGVWQSDLQHARIFNEIGHLKCSLAQYNKYTYRQLRSNFKDLKIIPVKIVETKKIVEKDG